MNSVLILSGGLDSTTLAYELAKQGDELTCISFNYGQKHSKELAYAEHTGKKLGEHRLVDLKSITGLLDSALTTDKAVPEGHYAAANMAQTVVPNRNAIMLSIAFGAAVSLKADRVAFAAHAGDHDVYPDCRPEFVDAFNIMERVANEGFGNVRLYAPYINMTKATIVKRGAEAGVPYEETWSCYKGGEKHCSKCGTCAERREAFILAGVEDPTEYDMSLEGFKEWWNQRLLEKAGQR